LPELRERLLRQASAREERDRLRAGDFPVSVDVGDGEPLPVVRHDDETSRDGDAAPAEPRQIRVLL